MNGLQQALIDGTLLKLEKIGPYRYMVLRTWGDQFVSHDYNALTDDFSTGKYHLYEESALNGFDARVRMHKACNAS